MGPSKVKDKDHVYFQKLQKLRGSRGRKKSRNASLQNHSQDEREQQMISSDVVTGFDCVIRNSGNVNVFCKGCAMIRYPFM